MPVATVDIAALRAQANGLSGAQLPTYRGARRSRAVPGIVVATTVLLGLSAFLPGTGIFGPAPTPASAAPASFVPLSDAVAAGLPATGGTTGTSTPAVSRPSAGRTPALPPAAPVASKPGASRCTAPCTTSQVISVTIRPGPFTVEGARDPIAVSTGTEGTGTARLSDVTVTDLRGSGTGWTLSASLVSVVDASGRAIAGATVALVPTCVRTAGPLTLETADPSLLAVGGAGALCVVPIASAGSLAGGLVSVTADLVLRGAPADSVVAVRLALALS